MWMDFPDDLDDGWWMMDDGFPMDFSLEFISDEVDLVHHGVGGRDVLLLLRHRPVRIDNDDDDDDNDDDVTGLFTFFIAATDSFGARMV